jgi:hypothetical protein
MAYQKGKHQIPSCDGVFHDGDSKLLMWNLRNREKFMRESWKYLVLLRI